MMVKKRRVFGAVMLVMGIGTTLLPANGQEGAAAFKIRPISSESILYKSPNPQKIYLGTPGIAVCPNGRLVASFHVSGDKTLYNQLASVSEDGRCFIYTSDDQGETWVYRANTSMIHARPFVAGDKLYVLGHSGDLRIAQSDDWGQTWSDYSDLTEGEHWAGSANNVLIKGGHVYLVMDRRERDVSKAWFVAELSPKLLRAKIGDDFLDSASWTMSSDGAFVDYVDDQSMETLFGVPFYPVYYPDRYIAPNAGRRNASPVGWLEGNVVQITDPHHFLYDPKGKTFHILNRSNTGLPDIGSMLKVTENDDGTMTTSIEKAPSGKDMLFIAIPGGQQTFYIHYDEPTKLYWMLTSQNTDSMTKAKFLSSERFGMAYDERRRLQLYFSKNLFDWCFAGLAAMGGSEKESRHCISMAVQGDDILFVSRSGGEDSASAHNCNLVTFHRIKNFRSLVY